MEAQSLRKEFERQIENLRKLNYPKLANMPTQEFDHMLQPLAIELQSADLVPADMERGTLPFVVVIKNEILNSEQMMENTSKNGVKGVTILRPHTSHDFATISDVTLPTSPAYLLVNIDRGKDTLNKPPLEAMNSIKSSGRSPLTIDEGIAIVTHFPDFLVKNNCFSLLASRTGKDKRVPAIWINSKKEPNLGWCWEGNPHTWLGSASCLRRIGY